MQSLVELHEFSPSRDGDKVVRFMLSGDLFHETVHPDGGFLKLVEVVVFVALYLKDWTIIFVPPCSS